MSYAPDGPGCLSRPGVGTSQHHILSKIPASLPHEAAKHELMSVKRACLVQRKGSANPLAKP